MYFLNFGFILNYCINLLLDFFRKIIKFNSFNTLKSTNKYHQQNSQKSSRKSSLYFPMLESDASQTAESWTGGGGGGGGGGVLVSMGEPHYILAYAPRWLVMSLKV